MQANTRDRLQPSLLDRLIDRAPAERQESNAARVLSRAQLRAAVLRDLSWLFNAVRAEPGAGSARRQAAALWQAHPLARRSVLNYGMPAFAGSSLQAMDSRAIERAVADAITAFEPRLEPGSLEVRVGLDAGDRQRNTLEIIIRARLWSQPVPLELLLAADMDVETGHTRLREIREADLPRDHDHDRHRA